jgi:hypothetical protein
VITEILPVNDFSGKFCISSKDMVVTSIVKVARY